MNRKLHQESPFSPPDRLMVMKLVLAGTGLLLAILAVGTLML
jgi:hypothetical protein